MTINCTYDTPVLYDGSTPTGEIDAFNFKNVVCTTESVGTSSVSTSSPVYINGFSYGESLIILLLLGILLIQSFELTHRLITGIKISENLGRVFHGNNSKDGKEIKKI